MTVRNLSTLLELSHLHIAGCRIQPILPTPETWQCLISVLSATSSELDARVCLLGVRQDRGVSHAYTLSDVGLWYSERGLLVMDLKPARSQDLWWCECVGVHLLQTHRSECVCGGEEGGRSFQEWTKSKRGEQRGRQDNSAPDNEAQRRLSSSERGDSDCGRRKVLKTEPFATWRKQLKLHAHHSLSTVLTHSFDNFSHTTKIIQATQFDNLDCVN